METNSETPNMQLMRSSDHQLQMMPIEDAKHWYLQFCEFTKSILKTNLDYGIIPGTPKPSLYKPGAEKLRFVYGLGVEFECIDKIVDLDRPFVDYSYRCTVKSRQGQILSQCEGNCNSMEAKFGYQWKTIHELPEGTDISKLPSKSTGKKQGEFDFAIHKAETTGQYGKPAEYWQKWKDAIDTGKATHTTKQSKSNKTLDYWELDETVTVYRITNPDVVGMKNTIMKMAQKRAFVGAILLATGASEFFTQDVEDMELNGNIYSNEHPIQDAEVVETTSNTTQPNPQQSQQPASSGNYKPTAIHEPDPVPAQISTSWYAKLDRCRTKEDVDDLAVKNQTTVEANPQLRDLFKQYKTKLPQRNSEKEVAHA